MFSGYENKQFFLSIISMDPWDILRNFTIPDETTVETNMRGKKKKKGDVEGLLIVERNKGIIQIDEQKFLLVPPILTSLSAHDIMELPIGFLQIGLFEDNILIETDPIGIHPAYYARIRDGYVVSSRIEWLNKLTPLTFEVPNNTKLELTIESAYQRENAKKSTLEIHDISSIKSQVKRFIDLIESIPNLNIVFIYEANHLSFYTLLEIIKSEKLAKSLTIVVKDEKDLNVVKQALTEFSTEVAKVLLSNNVTKSDTEILVKAEEVEELTNRYELNFLSVFLQKNTLFIFSISNYIRSIHKSGEKSAVDVTFESGYYRFLRELFKVSWPSTITDPLLYGELKEANLEAISNVIIEYLNVEFKSFLNYIL